MRETIRTICLVIITCCLCILLYFCQVIPTRMHDYMSEQGYKYSPDLNIVEYGDTYLIYVDDKTNVEYIITYFGISPRYNVDGSLYVYESN